MRFRFCGNGDCPDWVLAEINALSRLSSVKLKLLGQIVAQGIIDSSIEMAKAEKLFSESKLDSDINLKACIACVSFIISSTARYNCDHGVLFTELQQLGLPREHSMSFKKVMDEYGTALVNQLRSASLTVNKLQGASVEVDGTTQLTNLRITVDEKEHSMFLSRGTVEALLENLKQVRCTMNELVNSPYSS
ncbi:hypothetical protein PPYR_03311 [Photinus pyralis]|uniref:COMM domain-containing protein n=1 Tax=Photinus pyralis TaxID=7054 RepID=A0A5N4A2I8_PHOPY|nr:COMM domain-containing protein 4 [Photinus pyralis]KAB0791511.1 hypothetical protein PPYR_03311 [Photinus pyralis]